MQEVLRALNALVAEGVIETYAIGGAVGAMAYIESVATEDVDAFVFLPQGAGGLLDLSRIYEALRAQGGVVKREHVAFGEWLLQILPDSNDLVREAIREARSVEFFGVSTRVFGPEYLCCIALDTGRAKDYLRVQMFFEEKKVEREALGRLAERYGLSDKVRRAEELARGA